MPFSLDLPRKLNLLVACAILPALLIILFSGLSQRDQAIEQTHQILENFTNGVADLQSEKALQLKLLLQTLAILPEVKNLERARCTRLFEEFLRDNSGFLNIALCDAAGVVVASGLPATEKVDLSDRTGFKEAVRTKAFSPGDFIIGRHGKRPALPFGMPVLRDDGGLAGVLLCSHDLQKFRDSFAGMQLPPGSRLALLDRNGVLMMAGTMQSPLPMLGAPIVARNWVNAHGVIIPRIQRRSGACA